MSIYSGLVLSQASDRPMYLQIMDQIRQRVASGDWPPGMEIPSIRALAAELRISVITVKRAYQELEAEGVILTTQGKGSFVSERVPKLKARIHREDLHRHLREAVEAAQQLGLSREELLDALISVLRQIREGDTPT